MSGFATAVGFLFSFMIIVGVVGYSYVSLAQNYKESIVYNQENKEQALKLITSMEIESKYYDSGRLKLFLKNTGKSNIFLESQDYNCFDIYINNIYVNNNDFNHYIFSPLGDYYVLKPDNLAVLDVYFDIDESKNNNIKIISCSGYNTKFTIEPNLFNWVDEDYTKKQSFIIENSGGSNLQDNYFLVELNSSNFDFLNGNEEEIDFYLPSNENSILDLTFDSYNQTLIDYSRYQNSVTLGSTSSPGSDDPEKIKGIFFNALNFDGLNDFLEIAPDNSLEIDKAITISTWLKWTTSGNETQTIFKNGLSDNNLRIINDGGVNDNKLSFELSIEGSKQTLFSNSKLDNSWHHIVATYNGSEMKLYIDNSLDSNLSFSGDIDTSSNLNFIASNNTNSYYNGSIDDFKLFNMALNESYISDLFLNKLREIKLNHSVDNWSTNNKQANISVKIPYIKSLSNVTIDLYYYKSESGYESNESGPTGPTVPSAISDLVSVKGNSKVDLIWSEPNNGGDSIIKYNVLYGTGGVYDNNYIDDSTPNTTITGLTNDVIYNFKVLAENSVGNSSDSNIVFETPSGTYWMTQDLTTDFGVDGIANQGTTPEALAQLLYANESSVTFLCIQDGAGGGKTNTPYAREYTPIFDIQTEIVNNVTAQLYVYSSNTNAVTWRAILYEYDDSTGDVTTLGQASNTSTSDVGENISLTFNNTVFNVSAGNRIKVEIDASTSNGKPLLCYGNTTQSFFTYDAN